MLIGIWSHSLMSFIRFTKVYTHTFMLKSRLYNTWVSVHFSFSTTVVVAIFDIRWICIGCFSIIVVVAIFDIRSIFIGWILFFFLLFFFFFFFYVSGNSEQVRCPIYLYFPTYLQLTGFSLNTTSTIIYKNICYCLFLKCLRVFLFSLTFSACI